MKKDAINPDHYKLGEIECIKAIESAIVNKKGIEAYCVGNVLKYLWRYESKNGIEDVHKSIWYANYLKENLIKNENIRKNNELDTVDVPVPTKSTENQEGFEEPSFQEHLCKSSKHSRCSNACVNGMWNSSYTSPNGGCINYEIDSL